MLYPVRVMLVAHKNYPQVEDRSQTDRVPIPRQYALDSDAAAGLCCATPHASPESPLMTLQWKMENLLLT